MGNAEKGKLLFVAKCAGCHVTSADGEHGTGPNLAELFGRAVGEAKGFAYGQMEKAKEGLVWNEERLQEFFKDPAKFVGAQKAIFHKMMNEKDRQDVIEFLKSLGHK